MGFSVAPFVGSQDESAPCLVQFQNFTKGDLLGLSFRVFESADYSPTGNSTPNPWHNAKIRDIVVKYNGGVLAQFPGTSYIAAGAYTPGQSANYYDGSIVLPGSVQPFQTAPTIEHIVHVDFTRHRAACFDDHMANTMRIPPGGILEVSFTTPKGYSTQYQLRYNAYYNALAAVQAGTVSLVM